MLCIPPGAHPDVKERSVDSEQLGQLSLVDRPDHNAARLPDGPGASINADVESGLPADRSQGRGA